MLLTKEGDATSASLPEIELRQPSYTRYGLSGEHSARHVALQYVSALQDLANSKEGKGKTS